MAGLLDLFGGGGSDVADIYGDLFTDKQKAALRDQQMTGLLGKLAGAFAAGGMPSRLPIPLGSTIGAAAAGLGGEDEAMARMLTGMKTAEAVRESKQTREWQSKLNQMLMPIWQRQMAQGLPLNPPPAAVPVAPTDGPPAPNAPSPPAAAPAGLPSQFGVPQQDLSRWGLPGAITPYPQQRAGLLPPPDQMVGQALPGEGVLAKLAAMQGGGGESGAPFGEDQAPSLRLASARAPSDPRGVAPIIEEAARRYNVDPNVALKVAQSEGLAKFYGDNGKSGTAFQLYTGGGLGNEFQKETGLDPLDPKNEPAAIDWAMRNVQRTGWSPYHGAAKVGVGPRTGLPGGEDYVIPSGRGVPASMLQRVADTGAPAPGAASTGTIPGLGMTPEALATLNALMKVNKLGSPFDSLLETYYKSPGYLAEKARTETQAQKDIALKMDPLITAQTEAAKAKIELEWKPKIEEAVQKLQSPILKERLEAKADIDRVTKEIEQNRTAALTPTTATVYGPGGEIVTQPMTQLELAKRQQARAERMARGDTTYQSGDIVGTPIGAAPAEHQYVMTPQGTLSAGPVPGTPAAQKAADEANKKLQAEQQKLISRDVVVQEVANIKNEMANATLPTTGIIGSWLQNTGDTAANNVRVARETLQARMSSDAITAMRNASPTGAALGPPSDRDLAVLRDALANLDQSQGKAQFLQRLDRVQQAYIDAVHGPGASRLLPETPVLKAPSSTGANATKPANEIVQNGWRYDATTHRPIGPVQ